MLWYLIDTGGGMEIIGGWFLFSLLVGVLGARMGRNGFLWFALSVLISPLIAVIALLVTGRAVEPDPNMPTPDTHVSCPACAELVRNEARVCKHCGCKLVPIKQ